ncbi:MAG: alkaline phosphatase family protein [Spirochaetales bacterium]|nr:alkaline phosphatase family protein [Spirochaetales bacterium]
MFKNVKILLFMVFLSNLSCVGMKSVDVQRDFVEGWLDFENSYSTMIPQTIVSATIENFLKNGDGEKDKKVLLIGYDGVRTDALANTSLVAVPYLVAQEHSGIYHTFVGGIKGNLQKTYSAPGWTTILTGQWADKHKVVHNFVLSKSDETPSFLARAKALFPEFIIASLVHWAPLNDNVLRNEKDIIDIMYNSKDDKDLFENTRSAILEKNADVIFSVFLETDKMGHKYGFSPFIPEYTQKITEVDKYAFDLIKSVESRENYANEDWLIILTTDHGGNKFTHGGQTQQERNTWLVVNQKKYLYFEQ